MNLKVQDPGRDRVANAHSKAATGVLIAAAGALGLAITAFAEKPLAAQNPSVAAAFDQVMRGWTAKYAIARASVAVMRHDRLVYAAGYGGRESHERVGVWSMSKAVTAACIATLVQDGRLRFDDPIGPVLAPLFAKFGLPADGRLAQVTVAQLLTHRSGLPSAFGDNKLAPGAVQLLQRTPLSEAHVGLLIGPVLKVSLATTPGETYVYSNANYLLLGQVIEAVTGNSYEAECGARVLARAGIKAPRLGDKWGRLAHSTAGWSLSGAEYLGFARLLAPRGAGPLKRATYEWLHSIGGKWTDERKTVAYTLGVMVRPVAPAAPVIFHGGGWLWYGTYSEKAGSWFVLTGDGAAWFASYDGVHIDTDPAAVYELREELWRAARRVSSWPKHDEFAAAGVGPIVASAP